MNILFICPYAPTAIRTRPYNLIRVLVCRGHSLTLATLWENESEFQALQDLERQGAHVIAAPLTKQQKFINAVTAFAAGLPLQAMYCWQPALVCQIAQQVMNPNTHFDLVHVEHLRGARYGLELKRRFAQSSAHRLNSGRPPIVWDSVDCISYLFEQSSQRSEDFFGRWVTRLELGRTRCHERWLVKQFSQTLVAAEQDKRAFIVLEHNGQNDGLGHISVLRNGVDLNYFAPGDAPRADKTIIFTGKMSYHANVTAALYLVDQIMPRVWQNIPEAHVQIVGYKPPRKLLDAQKKNPTRVSVIGSVPDLRPYLAKATVAAAPIIYGTGIQNKVLEAMAMDAPVVALPQAVAALSASSGRDYLLAQNADEFAWQIVRLLSDTALAARIGQAGRRYVESYHDWESIAAQLECIYKETINATIVQT